CIWSPWGQRLGAVRRSSSAWRVTGRNFSRPSRPAASEWGSSAADRAAAGAAVAVPSDALDMVAATIAPLPQIPRRDALPLRQEPRNCERHYSKCRRHYVEWPQPRRNGANCEGSVVRGRTPLHVPGSRHEAVQNSLIAGLVELDGELVAV